MTYEPNTEYDSCKFHLHTFAHRCSGLSSLNICTLTSTFSIHRDTLYSLVLPPPSVVSKPIPSDTKIEKKMKWRKKENSKIVQRRTASNRNCFWIHHSHRPKDKTIRKADKVESWCCAQANQEPEKRTLDTRSLGEWQSKLPLAREWEIIMREFPSTCSFAHMRGIQLEKEISAHFIHCDRRLWATRPLSPRLRQWINVVPRSRVRSWCNNTSPLTAACLRECSIASIDVT